MKGTSGRGMLARKVYLIACMCVLVSGTFAQSNAENLTGGSGKTWKVVQQTVNGTAIELSEMLKYSSITYRVDSTAVDSFGTNPNSIYRTLNSWKFENEESRIVLSDEQESWSFDVISLTADTMIITYTVGSKEFVEIFVPTTTQPITDGN